MMKIANFIMDAVAPRHCAGCKKGKEILCSLCTVASFKLGGSCVFCNQRNGSGKICSKCRNIGISKCRNIERVLWAGEYKNALKSAILELKYKKRKELAEPLGNLIFKKFAEFYPKYKKGNFLIIPIPLHPKKEHERGFNQAEILAQEFGKISGIGIVNDLLLKIHDTKTQVEMKNKESRIKNLENAFALDPSKAWVKFGNKTIILVDDVATTGATFMHASRALEKLTSSPGVICLAVAHGY